MKSIRPWVATTHPLLCDFREAHAQIHSLNVFEIWMEYGMKPILIVFSRSFSRWTYSFVAPTQAEATGGGGRTSLLIWAGTLANSGLLAKVARFSTASMSGLVATRHLLRFSSEKSPSKAWGGGGGGRGEDRMLAAVLTATGCLHV